MSEQELHNILVIDDDIGMINGYQIVLGEFVVKEDSGTGSDLDDLASELFDNGKQAGDDKRRFIRKLVCCTQGLDGVEAVERSMADGQRFSAAFIDMRIPPGIDGLETAVRIREIDPDINIVIVTAYSDHHSTKIAELVGPPHRLFYLGKPFEPMEVQQFAAALSYKWSFEANIKKVNDELARQNAELERTIKKLTASAA